MKAASAETKAICSLPLTNSTFVKSFRFLVFTKVNGAWPTKDGGYLISGTTDPDIMMVPPDGFVAKLDKQGNVQWAKLLKTTNGAGVGNRLGEEDVQSIIELKNGDYVMASKVWGFITAAESNSGGEVNKILLTRLDKNGRLVWSKSFPAFVTDIKNSLLETNDNGILFYANISDLAPAKRGEDSEVYNDLPFASLKVLKFDSKGNLKWSKNIKNFIARSSDSYLTTTADGGYALAGNFGQDNPAKEAPYNFDTYPGLAKFDKDFNFVWAKSLEGIPLEMAAAILQEDGSYKLGTQQMRQGAMIARGLVRTKDNGFLVLGNLSSALSLMTDSLDLKSGQLYSYLVAYKFNSAGALDWAKRITLGYNAFTYPLTDYSITLAADNNIMIAGPVNWKDNNYTEKSLAVIDRQKWYIDKYGEAEMLKEDKAKTQESRNDWNKVKEAVAAVNAAAHQGFFTLKTDQDLNIKWAKAVKPFRSADNYVLKATKDNGGIIAGEYGTNVVHAVSFGEKIYFRDGFLMKFDASGNVKNNAGWLTEDYSGQIVTEMMTPYAVSNNLSAAVKNFSVRLTTRKPEFSVFKKTKTTTNAAFNTSKTTLCPITPKISASDTPLQNSTSTSLAERTWPQIYYERAVPGELMNDKSRTINGELLPILNQLYNNQVKMIDNMGGAMLEYVCARVITTADITAIKTYLEGLGYKTQDERRYELTTYKPGYWLVITFSTDNADKAFIQVTF